MADHFRHTGTVAKNHAKKLSSVRQKFQKQLVPPLLDACRTVLQELGYFSAQMVAGKHEFDGKLVSIRHDWRYLEEDLAQLKLAMSERARQLDHKTEAAIALQSDNMAQV